MRHFLLVLACALSLATAAYAGTPSNGKRVVFIGDSITDGMWGCGGGFKFSSAERNHSDLNHIYGHGFMEMVASDTQSRYPKAGFVFFNRGISGNKLPDLAARWKEDALDLDPDVLSVLVGVNDIGAYLRSGSQEPFNKEEWKNLYRDLLRQAREKNPSVKLVLCTPFVSRGGNVEYEKRAPIASELAGIVREVAKEFGAVLVPYDELFAKLIASEPSPNYWMWDGTHPTSAGHRRMADLWEKKVRLK